MLISVAFSFEHLYLKNIVWRNFQGDINLVLTFSGCIWRIFFFTSSHYSLFLSTVKCLIHVCYFFTLFFHLRTECVLTELYSLRKLWSGIFVLVCFSTEHLNMNWFKPTVFPETLRQTLWYYLCKNWLVFVRQHALGHLHCYLLIRDCLQSGKYHYICDFASEEKKTASLSNEHKMSYKKLITMNYWQLSPILPSSVLECCLEFLHFWEHTHLQRILLPTYE